jgi:hypothetical protein
MLLRRLLKSILHSGAEPERSSAVPPDELIEAESEARARVRKMRDEAGRSLRATRRDIVASDRVIASAEAISVAQAALEHLHQGWEQGNAKPIEK